MSSLDALMQASSVENKVYQVNILTPLFMHGWQRAEKKHDGKTRNEPIAGELRPPSFKGIWRYWWRALQTGLSHAELLSREQQMFGGSGGSDDETRSPVSLKVSPVLTSSKKYPVRPHKKSFSVLAIEPGKQFSLELAVQKKDRNKLPAYLDSFSFTLMLAGFGQRGRRAGGALQAKEQDWKHVDDFRHQLQDLLGALGVVEQFTFDNMEPGWLLKRAQGTAKHPVLCAAWVGEKFNTAENARIAICQAASSANPPGKGNVQHLGSAIPKRVASPLHATVRRIGEGFYPVVSEVMPQATRDGSGRSNAYLTARDKVLRAVGVVL